MCYILTHPPSEVSAVYSLFLTVPTPQNEGIEYVWQEPFSALLVEITDSDATRGASSDHFYTGAVQEAQI